MGKKAKAKDWAAEYYGAEASIDANRKERAQMAKQTGIQKKKPKKSGKDEDYFGSTEKGKELFKQHAKALALKEGRMYR